jgi:hypothetical protein
VGEAGVLRVVEIQPGGREAGDAPRGEGGTLRRRTAQQCPTHTHRFRLRRATRPQVRRMREAREAGWYVKVLYVRVPIKTAIQRAMLRTRRVSPERIAMYQAKISKALVIAAKVHAPCAPRDAERFLRR